jgi:hypothetical protein
MHIQNTKKRNSSPLLEMVNIEGNKGETDTVYVDIFKQITQDWLYDIFKLFCLA